MDASESVQVDRLFLVLNGSVLSLLVSFYALKAHFYRPLRNSSYLAVPKLSDLVFVFFVFLSLNLIVIPLVASLWFLFQEGPWDASRPSVESQIWSQAAALWVSVLAMWLICFLFKPTALQSVSASEEKENKKGMFYQFGFGAMTWLICYPLVFTLNQALALILNYFFHLEESEQVAVKLLKLSYSNPFSMVLYFVGVVLAVPILEEFLFRGILQRWLSVEVGPWKGIVLASLIFTAMHYAGEQGVSNLVLLPCLFILSCFLGYLYERQRSLWAPIGLHATFNLMSALVLLYKT